jgi:hypothetical protein
MLLSSLRVVAVSQWIVFRSPRHDSELFRR